MTRICDLTNDQLVGTVARSLADYPNIGVVYKMELKQGLPYIWVRWMDKSMNYPNGEYHDWAVNFYSEVIYIGGQDERTT